MIRGLYTAVSGMLVQQQRQDNMTNNLANINTPGYKSNQGIIRAFPEALINALNLPDGKSKIIGSLNQGVFLEENIPILLQGDLIDTGVSNHMAIWDQDINIDPETGQKPMLFFTLEDEEGNRFYTRSGLFTEDAAGQLVSPEGYLVLDDWNYPIQVGGRPFKIDEKGNIYISDEEDSDIQIQLTKIDNPNKMVKYGNGFYRVEDEDIIDTEFNFEEENYKLFQGKLERSNVDPTQTIVDMMSALRIYEANQKVIQSLDRTLEKAVNEIGRV